MLRNCRKCAGHFDEISWQAGRVQDDPPFPSSRNLSKSTAQVVDPATGVPLWEFHASGKSIQVFVEGGSVSEGKYLNAGVLAEEEQQAMNANVRNARQRVFTDLLSRRSPRDASVPLKKLRAAFQAETSKAKLRRGKYGTVVALAFNRKSSDSTTLTKA